MESKIKHLEMIESIIERMGNNSFQLKGWAVALVAIVGGFASHGSDKRFFLIAVIPIIAFWFLDAFYLMMERRYKILYKNVAEKEVDQIDFQMDIRHASYTDEEKRDASYCRCLFSITEWLFYVSILIAVLILAWILILT